jgi:hypothetical protein
MKSQNENSATDQKNQKNKNYVFVQKDSDQFTSIKLLDEKFNGVIYRYGKVAFGKEENADGKMPMKFDYDVIRNPSNVDTESEEFINVIGDILIEVLDEQLKGGKVDFK